jgi:hypothetical protein
MAKPTIMANRTDAPAAAIPDIQTVPKINKTKGVFIIENYSADNELFK